MKNLNIAIVEDDEDDRDLICSVMQQKNKDATITSFEGGKEFLEFMATSSVFPDLIITDLRMPLVTGHDVIKTIKSNDKTKDIDVVVLSTSGNEQDVSKAMQLGASNYFVKPYHFEEYKVIAAKILKNVDSAFLPFVARIKRTITTNLLFPLFNLRFDA